MDEPQCIIIIIRNGGPQEWRNKITETTIIVVVKNLWKKLGDTDASTLDTGEAASCRSPLALRWDLFLSRPRWLRAISRLSSVVLLLNRTPAVAQRQIHSPGGSTLYVCRLLHQHLIFAVENVGLAIVFGTLFQSVSSDTFVSYICPMFAVIMYENRHLLQLNFQVCEFDKYLKTIRHVAAHTFVDR